MSITTKLDLIFKDCLFNDDEIKEGIPEDAVLVEGIVSKFGFHPERLAIHKEEIAKLIALMPDEFHQNGGGGWSFLNLCMDKDGNQWGEHTNMEQLVTLAIATDQGKYQMPREMWSVLPGGMPYIVFT